MYIKTIRINEKNRYYNVKQDGKVRNIFLSGKKKEAKVFVNVGEQETSKPITKFNFEIEGRCYEKNIN